MPNAVEVPMSLFGGLDTELSPPDIPEGISPGNNDVAYLPGSVFSRPGLHKIYLTPNLTGESFVYIKKYTQPNGAPLNLLLTFSGNLYKEDPIGNPGVLTLIGQTVPFVRGLSVTAFGREYLALSDGQHGRAVPCQYDGTNLDRVTQYGPGAPPTVTSDVGSLTTLTGLSRTANVVYATTAGQHFLRVGFQAQISNVPASDVGGGISFIFIDNESLPGLATVNTVGPHGLVPGAFVSMTGIVGQVKQITSIVRAGGIVTVQLANPITWSPGDVVSILNCDSPFNTTTTILNISGPNGFTYAQANTTDGGSVAHGQAGLQWPIADSTVPNFFQVQTVPGASSFTIALNYSDGTWGGGSITFQWNGIYYVTSVPNANAFTYQQYGPDSNIGTNGTVHSYGQAAPGVHQMQVMFLTRQGYITKPSPPVTFVANGGQYITARNIPIGPSNVIARILAFTGANGSNFFYIPVPAVINGTTVATATQINDNTTTTYVCDFSDNTLFAASAINVPGNNLSSQVVLGPCLGAFAYASRVFWWGLANEITNFLNLDFAGGFFQAAPQLPCGWQAAFGSHNALAHVGMGIAGVDSCLITPGSTPALLGELFQPAFEDGYGVPILTPNTLYRWRVLAQVNGGASFGVFTCQFFSPSAGVLATANLPISLITGSPGYFELPFDQKTPLTIPPDTVLRFYTLNSTSVVQFSEIQIIYAETPYLSFARASYVDNPEAFDGVTGNIGPVNDTILNCFQIRDELYFLTPRGVYQTSDAVDSEPSTWLVRQVASDCGLLGPFALDTGEDWALWGSASGLRGFSGGEPAKLSQEIQTLWDAIVPSEYFDLVVKNDPVNRRVYLNIPAKDRSVMYVMDYRENDLMAQIISAAPVRISLAGRMISSDLGRKWTLWNLPMTYTATLYHAGVDTICLAGVGTGNVYYLDPAKLTDDDFGQIRPYYITYGFVNHDQEQAFQLGSQRKLYKTINLYIQGVGQVQITPLVDSPENAQPSRPLQTLQLQPTKDKSWGLNVSAERCFFKIAILPLPNTTDVKFDLQKLMVRMMKHPMTPMRSAL